MFWPSSALDLNVSEATKNPEGTKDNTEASIAEYSRRLSTFGQHLFYAVSYSVGLFLPVLSFQVGEAQESQGLGREIYSFAHQMVGWVLVPLLLASISCIVRRE